MVITSFVSSNRKIKIVLTSPMEPEEGVKTICRMLGVPDNISIDQMLCSIHGDISQQHVGSDCECDVQLLSGVGYYN